jgi:hypothetical protein
MVTLVASKELEPVGLRQLSDPLADDRGGLYFGGGEPCLARGIPLRAGDLAADREVREGGAKY